MEWLGFCDTRVQVQFWCGIVVPLICFTATSLSTLLFTYYLSFYHLSTSFNLFTEGEIIFILSLSSSSIY